MLPFHLSFPFARTCAQHCAKIAFERFLVAEIGGYFYIHLKKDHAGNMKATRLAPLGRIAMLLGMMFLPFIIPFVHAYEDGNFEGELEEAIDPEYLRMFLPDDEIDLEAVYGKGCRLQFSEESKEYYVAVKAADEAIVYTRDSKAAFWWFFDWDCSGEEHGLHLAEVQDGIVALTVDYAHPDNRELLGVRSLMKAKLSERYGTIIISTEDEGMGTNEVYAFSISWEWYGEPVTLIVDPAKAYNWIRHIGIFEWMSYAAEKLSSEFKQIALYQDDNDDDDEDECSHTVRFLDMAGGDCHVAILVAIASKSLTGSDCIHAICTDVWAPAVVLQKENIKLNEAEAFVESMEGDMFQPLAEAGLQDFFDVAFVYPTQLTREEYEEEICTECGPEISLYTDKQDGKKLEESGNTALIDIFLRGISEYMRTSGKNGRNTLLIGTDQSLTNYVVSLGEGYALSGVHVTNNMVSELVEIVLPVFGTLQSSGVDDGGDAADDDDDDDERPLSFNDSSGTREEL